jgi:hypothetical protein
MEFICPKLIENKDDHIRLGALAAKRRRNPAASGKTDCPGHDGVDNSS